MRENESIAVSRPGAGRPTRARAEARQAELLDTALNIFLEKGYEQATIEAIAAAVGMTKRTIYASYTDKSALFRAAVKRAIERYAISPEALQAIESADLATTLTAVARMRLHNVMTPAGMKLQRVLNVESFRFPDIFSLHNLLSVQPTVQFLGERLRCEAAAGNVEVEDPEGAASGFMMMALTGPTRAVAAGGNFTEEELNDRIAFAVRLFLNGVRKR